MGKFIEIQPGTKYGRLTVLERAGSDNHGALWRCRCECGNISVVRGNALRSGRTVSCGCYRLERCIEVVSTHGQSKSKLSKVWSGMKWRCYDPNSPVYQHYGGRGITVCDEWRTSFENFQNWAMKNGYREGLSIDRIDNDGPYGPENCRWVGHEVQMNNTRRNHFIEYGGEVHTVSEWAHILGVSVGCLFSRLRRGWSDERTLSEPIIRR